MNYTTTKLVNKMSDFFNKYFKPLPNWLQITVLCIIGFVFLLGIISLATKFFKTFLIVLILILLTIGTAFIYLKFFKDKAATKHSIYIFKLLINIIKLRI